MIIDNVASLDETPTSIRARRRRSFLVTALAAAAAAALYVAVGAPSAGDPTELAPPVAIAALADADSTTVQGEVAEIFGNKFILADPTGRALIETGRAGEGGDIVTVGEPVIVHGRFHHGFLHAGTLVRADGHVLELHPPHPPHKHAPRCAKKG